ncbi:MAG TPA: hypothetical protein VKC66_31265 [Xanthobacteraceae bacterium]|nr:hypothetical protein [Xanthobacteraceae bacterium]
MYRQGDVLIIPVRSIPEKLDPIDRKDGRVVLAHGEVADVTQGNRMIILIANT